VCDSCRDIDSGRFVDYTELDAASNRGVDEVQALLEQAVYKPVQGRFKVFMIDEVHMLTNTAFNAMLKTLEEPPEYLKFVLATTDPQKVPVTVLSRCLQFNLRPMAPETVYEHLGQVLASEGVPSEPMALRLLARAARGSMRDALSLTDQAIAFGGGQLQEATVRQMLGAVDRSHVFRLIAALAAGDGRTVVETVDALRVNGFSAASTLEEMTGVLQRMAVAQQVPQAASSSDDPEAAETLRLAQAMPADETQLLYSLCLHGRGELGLAPDEYAALTMVLLRLLAFKPAAAAEKKTLKPAEPASPAAASGSPRPAAPAAAALPAATPSPVAAPASARAASVLPPAASLSAMPSATPVASQRPAAVAAGPAPAVPVKAPVPAQAASTDYPDDYGWTEADEAEFAALMAGGPAEAGPALAPVTAPLPAADQPVPKPVSAPAQREAQAVPEPASASHAAQAPAQALVSEPAVTGAEADFWFDTVMALSEAEAITALVRELALQSELVARQADEWLLRSSKASLVQSAARERLQAALQQAGHAVRLRLEVGDARDTPAHRLAAAAAERQRQAEQTLLQDPFVQAMLRDFGGKIVPGSIKPI
ncbi:MAG: hypothetical protein RLZZ555_1602, partial [Pseudomonadota bacterium]